MSLNEATRSGLDVAINEADFVGLAFDLATRTAVVTLLCPTLADDGQRRVREVQLLLHPIARVAASLRSGPGVSRILAPREDARTRRAPETFPSRPSISPARSAGLGGGPIEGRDGAWNDRNAAVVPQRLEDLAATVRSFGGQPIYGFEFFDVHEQELAKWGDRTSLDWRSGDGTGAHSIVLFQEGIDRHLDLCLWFDDLEILDGRGMRIRKEDFVAQGRAWWRAFRAGDERAQGHGMVALHKSDATETR